MYPGGTPLFNESTGARRDRLEYARSKNPELAKACAAAQFSFACPRMAAKKFSRWGWCSGLSSTTPFAARSVA